MIKLTTTYSATCDGPCKKDFVDTVHYIVKTATKKQLITLLRASNWLIIDNTLFCPECAKKIERKITNETKGI